MLLSCALLCTQMQSGKAPFCLFCCVCWVGWSCFCCDCPQNWWFSWCWSINAVVEFKREVSHKPLFQDSRGSLYCQAFFISADSRTCFPHHDFDNLNRHLKNHKALKYNNTLKSLKISRTLEIIYKMGFVIDVNFLTCRCALLFLSCREGTTILHLRNPIP